jgi:hypothetical protein
MISCSGLVSAQKEFLMVLDERRHAVPAIRTNHQSAGCRNLMDPLAILSARVAEIVNEMIAPQGSLYGVEEGQQRLIQ